MDVPKTAILVFRPGALGDLLLSLPALRALRRAFPGARLILAGYRTAAALAVQWGFADVALSQDDERLLDLFRGDQGPAPSPASGGWEVAVCWLKDADGTVAAALRRLDAKRIVIAPSAPAPDQAIHAADHLLATLAPLGIAAAEGPLEPPAPAPEAEAWAAAYLSSASLGDRRFVVIHPGSGGARKNWSPAGFAAVVRALLALGVVPLVIGGPADEVAVRSLLDALPDGHSMLDDSPLSGLYALPDDPLPLNDPPLAGLHGPPHGPLLLRHPPLSGLAALLGCCAAYLGNDSGISHLAALVGAPTIALFGPTDPTIWAPRGSAVTIIRWPSGPDDLSPAVVLQAILRQL